MAFSRIQSAQLTGLGASSVVVETDISRGLYLFQIVGLPDKAVEESRERVISALRNSTGKNPKAENQKVIVSLSPAELKKEGAYFDLAIAIGYLCASGELSLEMTKDAVFVGELALNGEVRPIKGLLSIARWAKESGITTLFIPQSNHAEASLVDGITFYLVATLQDLVSHLKNKDASALPVATPKPTMTSRGHAAVDFADVRGQESAKRALTIAATGGHNIILYGPPGTGKTMLAKAFHSILPPLTNEEFLEVATIYSSIGLITDVLDGAPPLRSPHHSASHVAVIGGGQNIRPGDITLSHRGVLYLDEFPEFDRRVVEALREPLEEGHITVARAKGSQRFPARFILLAAMNPCPCGYRGTSIKSCTCSAADLARYERKLSGPIVDRIDLWVPVGNVEYESLHEKSNKSESAIVATHIVQGRHRALKRTGKLNSELSSHDMQSNALLSEEAKEELQNYAKRLHLSPRSYMRTIKVARTIADLDCSDAIEVPHVLEALQYRPKME